MVCAVAIVVKSSFLLISLVWRTVYKLDVENVQSAD